MRPTPRARPAKRTWPADASPPRPAAARQVATAATAPRTPTNQRAAAIQRATSQRAAQRAASMQRATKARHGMAAVRALSVGRATSVRRATSVGRATSVECAASTSADSTAAAPGAPLGQQVGQQNTLHEMQARIDRTDQSLAEIKGMLARLVPGPLIGTGNAATDTACGNTIQHLGDAHPTSLASADGLPGPSAPWPSLHGPIGSNLQMSHDNVTSFVSPCLPIHSHVADKDRMKVWSGEYVDLMTLLKADHADEPAYALSFSVGAGGLAPEIRVAPRKKPTMSSYAQWANGFQVYMSIYLSQPLRAPEAPALLKYQQTIQNLAERGGGWRSYDEAFRTMRNLHGWQWDSIHWELWMRAVQPMPPQSHTNAIRPAFLNKDRSVQAFTRRATPPICFAFNKEQPCRFPNCTFVHQCTTCRGNHPATRCNGRAQLPNTSRAPVTSQQGR